jgi:hypothetical protein
MIKLFSRKPDHAMCDLAAATRILDELPRDDDQKFLGDLAFWLDSVNRATDFSLELRSEIVMLLDERGRPLKAKLLDDYLSAPHLRDFQGFYLWQGIRAFVEAVSEAYTRMMQEYQRSESPSHDVRELMPLVCVRQLQATSEQMKLDLMRYIEIESPVWKRLYACYRFAEAEQITGVMVFAYPGYAIHTSPQRELLHGLVMYISSPGTLAADQIEVSYRIAARLASFFDLKQAADEDCPYLFDLSADAAPRKISASLKPLTNMRFFGAVRALPALIRIIDQAERDRVWSERRFASEFTPAGKLTVLKHLAKYWAAEPPHRQMERRDISATVEVTHGFRVVSQLVAHLDAGNVAEQDARASAERSKVDLAAAEIEYSREVWSVSEMSIGGIAATLAWSLGTWIKIGDLCAIKPEKGKLWWVGAIRRLHTDHDKKVHVGIEVLARRPASVWLRVLGKGAERVSDWASSSGSFQYDYLPVILLPDAHNAYLNATMLLESGNFVSDGVYEAMMGEKSRNIKLTKLIAEGEDYEHVEFEWLD